MVFPYKNSPGYKEWFEKQKHTRKYKKWIKKVSKKRVVNRRDNHGGKWGKTGRPANTPEVLWSKVDRKGADDCWPWKGYVNKGGYGRTWINGKGYYAHRVIFNLYHSGKLPFEAPENKLGEGFLRHKCDNPICCNPGHLLLGTQQDNIDDKVRRGRQHQWGGGIGSPRAKLSAEQVTELRRKKGAGVTTKELMKEYDLGKATVNQIVSRKAYKDVL